LFLEILPIIDSETEFCTHSALTKNGDNQLTVQIVQTRLSYLFDCLGGFASATIATYFKWLPGLDYQFGIDSAMETTFITYILKLYIHPTPAIIFPASLRFGKSVRIQPDMIADDDSETSFRLDLSQGDSSLTSLSQDSIQTWMTGNPTYLCIARVIVPRLITLETKP
jgi:hypothetical protein